MKRAVNLGSNPGRRIITCRLFAKTVTFIYPSLHYHSMTETIFVICAHNDDQIVGAGGTLAKYAKEGKEIETFIMSFGESSHPHLKKAVSAEMRARESFSGNKILGCGNIQHFGLTEGKFIEDAKEKKLMPFLIRIVKEKKPTKLFTHSPDDPHPDHRAVVKLVQELIKKSRYKNDVYVFNVWNPINIRKRNQPKMVVDISQTFKTKVKAFKAHKSQKMAIYSLLWNIYWQAIINGYNNHCRYAEVFYKIQ
jgi:N-acetylglucosamine malate deacetylase 1